MKVFPEFFNADRACPEGAIPASTHALELRSRGCRLIGQVYTPNFLPGESCPAVINLHGCPGYNDNHDVDQAFRRAGFVSVHPFAPGAWGSEGYYSFDALADAACDVYELVCGKGFAENFRISRDNVFFFGHSMGGMAALNAMRRLGGVRAAVLAAPFDLGMFVAEGREEELVPLFEESSVLRTEGDSRQALMRSAKACAEKLRFADAAEDIAGRNILFIGGKRDDSAPADTMCEPLCRRLNELSPGSCRVELIDSDHGFNDSRLLLAEKSVRFLSSCVRQP